MSEPKPVNLFRNKKHFRPKGRQVADEDRAAVRDMLADASLAADALIENLHRIQDSSGGLRVGHLAALAQLMNLPYAAVYEVATFYHHFDVVREGAEMPPLTVRVCESLSCELAGAKALYQALQQQYGDAVRIKTAPCVGRCAEAPVAVVGQNAIAPATAQTVIAAVDGGESSASLPEREMQGYDAYRDAGGYAVYEECLNGTRTAEAVMDEIEQSGLRGLGGAGFPAGRKWKIVRGQTGEKIVAVNIDEGEPGTFKDRFYLEREPHRFLEGALIAAWVVGAPSIYIYLRDEYHGCRRLLEQELQRLRAAAFALPALILRRGAGAYICGEESAMIESIEGKRGEPRLRPPYVAEVGVFNRPTLEHNMETLHWIPDILRNGAAAYAAGGRRGRSGLRSFSVSGRVAQPGVKRAPAGITVRELIEEYCGGMLPGHTFYAYLPGGASGGILPARMDEVPLDFDTIQQHDADCFIGSAAVIILSDKDRARDAALNMMRFFADESCGQCTPCRVGTEKALALMQQQQWDVPLLEELAQAMVDASICGLGQAAPNPLRCTVKHFPDEIR